MKTKITVLPVQIRIDGQYFDTEEQPQDKESAHALKQLVTVWCVENKLLFRKNEKLYPTLDSHFTDHIYTVNFRQLCQDTVLQELLVILEDTEQDRRTTRLIDLYIQICLTIDSRFLNLYINKLIHLLENIYPDAAADHDWETIFATYPYLWLIYVVQSVLREHTPLP